VREDYLEDGDESQDDGVNREKYIVHLHGMGRIESCQI
jgi:hypothetical protein